MPPRSIALVVFADELDREHAAYGAVQNFVDVYESEVDRIVVVGPERIDIDRAVVDPVPVQRPQSSVPPVTVTEYIGHQVRIAAALWHERDRLEAAFFHIGGTMLLVPLLACIFAGVRTLLFVTGTVTEGVYARRGTGPLARGLAGIVTVVERVTCTLADDVILLSSGMDHPALEWPISPTIRAANVNYVDCDEFAKRTPIDDRPIDVVFVGRFATVKGIHDILGALPRLVASKPDIRIELIGDGDLSDEVAAFVDRHGLSENVTCPGWVDHDDLPARLDDARTLLLPSRSEGVPKALLEAMACGTVPVAAAVGGIPDLVDDGSNGFLLRDTDPAAIERTVTTVLERDDLDAVSDTARDHIERNYDYETIRDRYRRLLVDPESERATVDAGRDTV
ncbi:glycosyltransferase [Natrinema gari]|uniref:Glycosyl transferase, group 1 n=1 Tax=Natrinema gari JCM 14663 TaxID=1230459 RepID=L9YYH4_9EURY|nr:glycosyltransferase [Natrinema gari]ELY78502.1 glycosyl transferase, group 1 [Natrinema gari JCM 14663]